MLLRFGLGAPRAWTLSICLTGCALTACGGDDGHAAAPNSGADAAPEQDGGQNASDAAPGGESCEALCSAGRTPPATSDCSCDAVHMRLESLDEGFYAQPWPLATRLRDDGTLELTGFQMPAAATFVSGNLDTIARTTHGFSTAGAVFMSFDGALDPDSLPDAEESLENDASVYLVEVSEDSPTRGERTPITCSYLEEETTYGPPHFLACAPFPGFPLRPARTYALVLTDAVQDAEGRPLRSSQRFSDVLEGRDDGSDPLAAELVPAYAPLADFLLGEGEDLAHVAGASVFETQDPIAEMRALASAVDAMDAPGVRSLANYAGMLPAESGNYTALDGTYVTPIYQQGLTPYTLFGGNITFDEEGAPERAGTFPIRFALSIPSGPMPEGGWPVVLYAHGSGGDAYSYMADGTAYHLAAVGVAGIGIDAPVHGTRSGGLDPQFSFFNVTNVLALRDNIRQGAVDLLVLERFVEALDVAADDSPSGEAIRFDPERIYAMGHSQGGLLVPLMLPFAKHVKAAMLSGAGASISTSVVYKHEPTDIPALARGFLALDERDPLDTFHPVLTLLQTFSDVSDGVNYAPYAYLWEGGRGVDVWATQGLLDTYAPPQVTNPLVTAYGLEPVEPLGRSVPGLTLRGLTAQRSPVSANIDAADGASYTGVYSQYPNDGHFLIMQNPDAEAQLEHWFESLVEDGRAELIRP